MFYCGGILDDWSAGDNVDHEHARFLGHCQFIRDKLGEDAVDRIREEYTATTQEAIPNPAQPISLQQYASSTVPVLAYASAATTPINGSLFISKCIADKTIGVPAGMRPAPKNLHLVAPRDIRARLHAEPSLKLLSIGYKKPLLAQVIGEHLAETGQDFISFMDFFRAVQHAEQVLGDGAIDTLNDNYLRFIERMANPGPAPAPPTENALVAATSATDPSSDSATNSEQCPDVTITRAKKCNTCKDKAADTVFMPCRHMVNCRNCASDKTFCSICRREVEQCIDVYV